MRWAVCAVGLLFVIGCSKSPGDSTPKLGGKPKSEFNATVTPGPVTDEATGIASYPGSVKEEKGTAIVDTKDQHRATATSSSTDEPSKILEHFKKQLPTAQVVKSNADGSDTYLLTAQNGAKSYLITITRAAGEPTTKVIVNLTESK